MYRVEVRVKAGCFQPGIKDFLVRPVADGRFVQSEPLAQLDAEAFHHRAVRVVLRHEALLEVEQLAAWPRRVVEDFHEEVAQVDLDAHL